MAFFGVFLVMGAMSALLLALLGAFVTGILLLIAALVFRTLYRRGLRAEQPEGWQRVAGIGCAAAGVVLAVPPVVIWAVLVVASH